MFINGFIDTDVVCIYKGILFSHEKGSKSVIQYNIDGSQGHYAIWDKPDRETQTLHGIT